jgi:hypothetical protein
VLVGAVVVLALAGWGTMALLDRPLTPTPDRIELEALRDKLTAVRAALDPIAQSFTSEATTAPIDVGSYETRVAAAEKVVESVNDVQVTAPTSLEIRDLILTGGSEVVDGMQAALDALKHNDAADADTASAQVEDGLTQLDDAQQQLDTRLGTKQDACVGRTYVAVR